VQAQSERCWEWSSASPVLDFSWLRPCLGRWKEHLAVLFTAPGPSHRPPGQIVSLRRRSRALPGGRLTTTEPEWPAPSDGRLRNRSEASHRRQGGGARGNQGFPR